jgi:hypothetical protein
LNLTSGLTRGADAAQAEKMRLQLEEERSRTIDAMKEAAQVDLPPLSEPAVPPASLPR